MHRWRLMQPIALPANLPDTFYRGAGRIAHFRRLASPPGASPPEDWIASTTRRFGVDTDSGKRLSFGVLEFKSNRPDAEVPDTIARLALKPLKISKFLWATEV